MGQEEGGENEAEIEKKYIYCFFCIFSTIDLMWSN